MHVRVAHADVLVSKRKQGGNVREIIIGAAEIVRTSAERVAKDRHFRRRWQALHDQNAAAPIAKRCGQQNDIDFLMQSVFTAPRKLWRGPLRAAAPRHCNIRSRAELGQSLTPSGDPSAIDADWKRRRRARVVEQPRQISRWQGEFVFAVARADVDDRSKLLRRSNANSAARSRSLAAKRRKKSWSPRPWSGSTNTRLPVGSGNGKGATPCRHAYSVQPSAKRPSARSRRPSSA